MAGRAWALASIGYADRLCSLFDVVGIDRKASRNSRAALLATEVAGFLRPANLPHKPSRETASQEGSAAIGFIQFP
jgi:hypothetical protein